MKKKLFLHIGTYKTGSTSIQRFSLDHADDLRRQGIAFYRGQFKAENHLELYLASLRHERDSFAKLGVCQHITFDASFTRQIADRVHDFLSRCQEPCVLFTSEGLSLLRYADEIDRLSAILDAGNADVQVILYLRNKADFLRSYTNQLYKMKGRRPSQNRKSALYVEADTWLTDYDSLISTYQKGFGAGNVVVINYDEEMKRDGNVIPSFLRAVGVDASQNMDVASYFLKATSSRKTRSRVRRWGGRAADVWHKWTRRPAIK